MRRVMNQVTRTVAVLAIAAAPTLALAQTPRAAAQPNPAAEHLSAARSALNKVLNAPAPSGDAFKKLTDLKTHYIALEKAASTASPEWQTHYTEIDRLVTELLAGPSSSETPVGTSGRAGAPAKGLDPGIAANLENFRTELNAFSAAMSPGSAAPTPGPTPAIPAPAAAPPPSTPPPAAPPPAAPATPPAASPAPADDATIVAQVDQVMALIDSALAANAQQPTVSIDRATLEQIKTQLEQIKQRVKKP